MRHFFSDSDFGINPVFQRNYIFRGINFFPIEDENYYDNVSEKFSLFDNSYPENDLDNYRCDGDKIFDDYIQRRGILGTDNKPYFDKEYTSLVSKKIESKTTKETNLTELIARKPKRKPLFEVKKEIYEQPKIIKAIKEIPPDFFPENLINIIIDKFYY